MAIIYWVPFYKLGLWQLRGGSNLLRWHSCQVAELGFGLRSIRLLSLPCSSWLLFAWNTVQTLAWCTGLWWGPGQSVWPQCLPRFPCPVFLPCWSGHSESFPPLFPLLGSHIPCSFGCLLSIQAFLCLLFPGFPSPHTIPSDLLNL